MTEDQDGGLAMKGQIQTSGTLAETQEFTTGDDAMEIDSTNHRRTDHAPLRSAPGAQDVNMEMDSASLTKSRQAVSALQKDIGSAYLLCKESKNPLLLICQVVSWGWYTIL